MASSFYNPNRPRVTGPVKRIVTPSPKPKPKPKVSPAPAQKSTKTTGRGTGASAPKDTVRGSQAGKPGDLAKSLYDYYKYGTKPAAAKSYPPKAPKVSTKTTSPKPKPSPSPKPLPSGRPAKPNVKPGKPVTLPAAGPKTKKQAEVAARNADQARAKALREQEARKTGSGVSHKSESTQTGSNISKSKSKKIKLKINKGGIGFSGPLGGGGGFPNSLRK
jgi:hypothetical protein